ncbi:MAG: hypothetical protein B7Y25_08220 [Alphaproteobacteria bacterium 16-39-46]|nr:MAG: hypothetical protein B7Y25_08220 [Alphaproteobacteria bacterium 16-39-46]OZA41229.1 MAG: hypothetical protein B7X84_08350 [Alphaproteobacteria bacterium 17-39-52]HQS84868.1 DUF2000 family protein [Alphaproteobacteria bacterium]HQS94646.1 DUF2000 family protein [Alphaproteobacteria bacterium]
MDHDTKIGIIVRDDLQTWQKLNVTAFLVAGIAAAAPETIGEPYEDGSGNTYLFILGQPVYVFAASAEHLQRTRNRALSREVPLAIYTKDMFATSNDKDNRAVVKAVQAEDLDIVGLALRADRKTFDKIVNGLKLHA